MLWMQKLKVREGKQLSEGRMSDLYVSYLNIYPLSQKVWVVVNFQGIFIMRESC